MKKHFSARPAPRQIGVDDDDSPDLDAPVSGPAIKRPVIKARKSSSIRTSFRSLSVGGSDDDDTQASVVTPKRSSLSKVAFQRNASKRPSLLASQIPSRPADEDGHRPSYSAASLQELRNNTLDAPRDLPSQGSDDQVVAASEGQVLDLSSKFGSSLARYEQPSLIPSATEIAEKKARRARLAKEHEEFISLDLDDPDLDEAEDDDNVARDEYGNLILKPRPRDKWGLAESRIAQDDEDIMENFDEFTEDGRIALSRTAELDARNRRRQEISDQIAEAEAASNSESDDSERERIAAYEAAQTKHGTYAHDETGIKNGNDPPATPSVITPVPTVDNVVERLRNQLAALQASYIQGLKDIETLQHEKDHLRDEEIRLQKALTETAAKFQSLRKEKGLLNDGFQSLDIESSRDQAMDAKPDLKNRILRLESGEHKDRSERDAVSDVDEKRPALRGLGFGGQGHGFGASGMLFMPVREPDDGNDSDDH